MDANKIKTIPIGDVAEMIGISTQELRERIDSGYYQYRKNPNEKKLLDSIDELKKILKIMKDSAEARTEDDKQGDYTEGAYTRGLNDGIILAVDKVTQFLEFI